MTYLIGIDTGGTCTDAVLMEEESGAIIAAAKEATTHHDLAYCTAKALKAVINTSGVPIKSIKHIAVSSTLATNSVVENKGADVALLVIGYVKHFKLPVKAVVFIKGGHTIIGEEEEPLDIEYLADIVQGLRNEVDAYGVCSAMSMKNPSHELVAAKAISLIDGDKPVFCSHQISDIAGMEQRAATAGLHAKLMPLMDEYMAGVTKAVKENGLDCDIHIVAGNGSVVAPEHVIRHAGLTVASGPACTAHFGSIQTLEQALVIDVGGTTTDIAMVADGKTQMSPEGCQIGSWRTHVEAVDMHTGGIGGDSSVAIDKKGQITVGPIRVTPIALSENLGDLNLWLGPQDKGRLIVAQDMEETGNEVLEYIQKGPATPEQICKGTKYSGVTLERELARLDKAQAIKEYGFTPTDALHVLGKSSLGDAAIAQEAATILGTSIGLTAQQFAEQVIHITTKQIENLILDYVVHHFYGKSLSKFIAERDSNPMLGVDFTLKVPLIGIGAAAQHLLPGVAENLGTRVSFPDNCQVGNAIGAAHLVRGRR